MKCPICSTISKVEETRSRDDNTKRRRYKCATGHKFSTHEVISEASICEIKEVNGTGQKFALSGLWN
jgi:transcriptional regulator NrdR family protein